MTPQEVEQYVLIASDPTNLQNQQQANAIVNHWVSSTDDNLLADALIPILQSSRQEVVLFFVLTTFQKILKRTTVDQRARFRGDLLVLLLANGKETNSNTNVGNTSPTGASTSCWNPTYLRTKVGVILASMIQLDFGIPNGSWPNAFEDLQNPEFLQNAPDIVLRTLVALMEDFGHHETPENTRVKDILRGYAVKNENTPVRQIPLEPQSITVLVPPAQSLSAQLLKTIVSLLTQSLTVCNGRIPPEQLNLCVLALTALRGFMSWVDLSLILEEQPAQTVVMKLIFEALSKGSKTESPMADAAMIAVECLQELIARGMEDEKKIAILIHTNVLETIHLNVDLERVDASPIDVVMEVAKFINRTGLEVLTFLRGEGAFATSPTATNVTNNVSSDRSKIRSQILDLFFRCFAYDDIDVSGAVIPLAGSLVPSKNANAISEDQVVVLSQLLAVTFRQMRYPEEFQFDYEDEDEAEEEIYRTELRKLNQKFIRSAPEQCLQFMCQALSQITVPLSSAPTSDMEAALRLIYHYCEGIRPPPGMKVVMRNETFRNLLVALHKSDITFHPHREVLTLYYETAVRYYPLLKESPELLQKVLESLTSPCGLQHPHPRVRSRCCYMLLRLVKSVGSNQASENVLRPYVETAVTGIQGLLENNAVQLRTDDTLNLFETIGLLLGKTGLEPVEQHRFLTQVMTPHIRSINQVLERKELVSQDPESFGEMLGGSIAAIAFLSKGFKRPSEPVQNILLETLQIASVVLETLATAEVVRNKSMILIQRLIQLLGERVLPPMPGLLYLLISHCTTEDVLDVAQVINQLCIKFKEKAIPAIDNALLPFLKKCHALANNGVPVSGSTPCNGNAALVAPHQRTEQLSIQKLNYMVMQHVVANGATGVLLTPLNLPSLEQVLQSMSDGAVFVEDASMKKTCLAFFKDLLEQWLNADANQVTKAPAHTVVQGFVQYVCTVLIPGVLQSFGRKEFDVRDANQWRVVLEFAALLDVVRKHLREVYLQEVLLGVLTNKLGCPPGLVDLFRQANNRKALEQSLKTLIEHRAQN